jgi:phage shock protein A
MTEFIEKLNVLLRARLSSFLGSSDRDQSQGGGAPGKLPPTISVNRLGKDIDKEIAALRKRIDEALVHEDTIKNQLAALQGEIDTSDRLADEALRRGDDANARYLVQQVQRQQQRLTMLQSELAEHQRATSEFIERVNMLDSIVSDARRREQEKQAPPPGAAQGASERTPGAVLSDLLRSARERVDEALTTRSAEPPRKLDINAQPPAPGGSDQREDPKRAKADDELAQRRARLSKPE